MYGHTDSLIRHYIDVKADIVPTRHTRVSYHNLNISCTYSFFI